MNYDTFDPHKVWDMAVDPLETGHAWRTLRKKNGWSQDDLSLMFCEAGYRLSKPALSAIERGIHKPSLDNAFFFAGLCECTVEDVVVTYRRARASHESR